MNTGNTPIKSCFFITPSFRGGGAERAIITIANALCTFDDLDVSLVALTPEGPLRRLADTVDVIDIHRSRARYAIFDVKRLIQGERPDIVFSVLQQANIVTYVVDQLAEGDWTTVAMLQNYYERIIDKENMIISYLFEKALVDADVVIPNSKDMAKNLISCIQVSTDAVHPIYNPIAIDRVIEQSREAVDHEVFDHHPVLIGCGRLEEQKGFPYLIDALDNLKQSYPDAQLVLLGDGSLRNSLERQAELLDLEGSVHFFGFVNNPYKYMSEGDLFVLSSLWEGLPTVLIEAMASGSPVVSTDCPTGPREILVDGDLAPLVPPQDSAQLADGIRTVIQGTGVNKKQLIERANDFCIEAAISEYQTLISNYG